MIYKMKLNNDPFNKIKDGIKKVELRLNDEKRRLLSVGDIIEFTNITTNELLYVRVTDLLYFNSFEELYKCVSKKDMGYKEDDDVKYTHMLKYYSETEEEKYGVVGIRIKKLMRR